jgi:hypothetical protein
MERGDPDWLIWNNEPSNWSVKKMKSPDWPFFFFFEKGASDWSSISLALLISQSEIRSC